MSGDAQDGPIVATIFVRLGTGVAIPRSVAAQSVIVAAMRAHHALVPNAERTAVLVTDGALPAVAAKRTRTAVVPETLERELGLRAPFLRTAAVVKDVDGRPTTALLEFDAPRSVSRGSWIALDEAPGLAPPELREAAERWVAEQHGAPIPPERAPWARPGWLGEAEAWIAASVDLVGEPRLHAQWPLSSVLCANTSAGVVYFKAAFPLFRHEPGLTAAIAREHPVLAPAVVAIEPERGWLLMRELQGPVLGDLDRSRWPEAGPLLGEIHRAWSSRREEILALGADDRGLDTLVVPDELRADLDRLHELGLPETLVHGDFHPWNVVAGDRLVLYDWSDACLSHPLFDLLTYGWHADRSALLAAYGVSPETFAIAEPLACIHHAVSYERILEALEPADRWLFADVPGQLRARATAGNASQPG
jgi:phosphotransferase family enzyme